MNKYGARKRQLYGHTFDSQAEADYYLLLLSQKQAGEIADIKLHPKYELIPKQKSFGKVLSASVYTADFEVEYPDGRVEVIDVKGMIGRDFPLRRRLFAQRYPDIRLRVVKKKGSGWVDG